MTKGNTSQNELSLRERRAVAALLSAPTVKEAARQAGVSRKTLYTYLARPQFAAALSEARAEARRLSAARLDGLLTEALDVIGADMSAGAGAQYRLRAAGLIVRYAAGLQEYLELEGRVSALEARAKAAR